MGNSSPSAPARKHSVIVMVTECFLVLWAVLGVESSEWEAVPIVVPIHLSILYFIPHIVNPLLVFG